MTTSFLSTTNPKLAIGEYEPLPWLISILVTDAFWDRETLTTPRLDSSAFRGPEDWDKALIIPPYEDRDALHQSAAEYVEGHEEAQKLLNLALSAVEDGQIQKHVPKVDRWGEPKFPYYPDDYVYSYYFLLWAEKHYVLRPEIVEAAKYCIQTANSRQQAAERLEHVFPRITPENFEQLGREPLWDVSAASLYLLGRRSRVVGNEKDFPDADGAFAALENYIVDAHSAGRLPLVGELPYAMNKKVEPAIFIAWARSLPLTLPMLTFHGADGTRTAYCTPDMALMYDAVAHFWGEYDLNRPRPEIAPKKPDVVNWLLEEAKRRNMNFSRTRAEHLDTIMRCPESRKGGNTF